MSVYGIIRYFMFNKLCVWSNYSYFLNCGIIIREIYGIISINKSSTGHRYGCEYERRKVP